LWNEGLERTGFLKYIQQEAKLSLG